MTGTTIIKEEQFIVVDVPEKHNPAGPESVTTRLDIDEDLGFFEMDSIFSPHFSLHHASGKFRYNAMLKASNQLKTQYAIALVYEGRAKSTFDDCHEIAVAGGQGSFNFNPAVNESHQFFSGKATQINYFEIDADYFTRLLFEHDERDNEELYQLKEKVLRGEFTHTPVSIAAAHQRIVSDIRNCPLQGGLGNLMMEGSLQQLIALQLSVFGTVQERNEKISQRDKEITYGIKEYLDSTFNQDHSLLSLSKQFGINQCKLKKNFKLLVGVPVIEYVFNLKMEHARALLCDKGMYVSEVAPIIGYRNANHFATAFKRKFGVNPSRIRG